MIKPRHMKCSHGDRMLCSWLHQIGGTSGGTVELQISARELWHSVLHQAPGSGHLKHDKYVHSLPGRIRSLVENKNRNIKTGHGEDGSMSSHDI